MEASLLQDGERVFMVEETSVEKYWLVSETVVVREAWLDERDVTVVGVGMTSTCFLLGGCAVGDTERCCEVSEDVSRGSPSREGTGEGVAETRALSGVLNASSINSLARVIDF